MSEIAKQETIGIACQCLGKIRDRLLEHQPFPGVDLEDVQFSVKTLFTIGMGEVVRSTFELVRCPVKGFNSQVVEFRIPHAYCPFCGKKIYDMGKEDWL
jgi:hypothetical protein